MLLNLRTLSLLGVTFYSLAIITHILILLKVIPYNLVNGGRSTSFDEQAHLSLVNIAIAVVGSLFMVLMYVNSGLTRHWLGLVIFGAITLFWLLGFVMQLLGTPLEKSVMSVIVLFGLFVHVQFFIHTWRSLWG